MDRITVLADISIRRACGFAALGVATVMGAMSFDVVLCFRAGAILFSLVAAVLWWKAETALRRNVKRTELWTMLDGRPPVPAERVQQVLGNVLRERYRWHATAAACGAFGLWMMSFLLALARA